MTGVQTCALPICSIQNRAATDGQPDARADKEASEDCRQKFVRRDVGKLDEGKNQRQSGDRQDAFDGEHATDLAIADSDEWKIDNQDQDRQRRMKNVRQQHRNTRHAAVDETARQKKAFQPECGRKDSRDDQPKVQEAPAEPFHCGRG